MQNLNSLVTDRLKTMKANLNSKESKSLYEHLSKLIPLLASFQSDKISAIPNLQYISQYLKKNQYSYHAPLSQKQLTDFLNRKAEQPHWIEKEKNLFKHFRHQNSEERLIPNFQLQSERLFSKVGIGFSKAQAYRINSGLKNLGDRTQAIKLRFWGKILTKNGDYLIIQGMMKQNKPVQISQGMQKPKQGANYNTYWIAHSSLEHQWYQLPLVTPSQIRTARLIKHIFTGNMNMPVVSSPPFDGLQKHLLKAQIVRITHNCQIAPKGQYSPLEDNPDQIDFSEEFKMPQFAQLSNLQNWVHLNPYILKQGRSTYYIDPKLPEEQKQQALSKLGESDPKIQRLKAINEDKGLQKFGLQGCWAARTYGSTQLFNNVGKDEGTTSCYAVVSLRNPHWPGWTTVASIRQYASIYIGYGLKSSQLPFYPVGPQDIGLEADDVDEFHEPNPKDPPDELEPDSDQQNKKQE